MSVSLRFSESLRCESITLTLVKWSTTALRASLNSLVLCILVTEDVRILVRGPGDLSLQWLLREVVVALVCKTCGFLVVRLIMEGVAFRRIVMANARFIVNDVLVGVAEHICAVLTLL